MEENNMFFCYVKGLECGSANSYGECQITACNRNLVSKNTDKPKKICPFLYGMSNGVIVGYCLEDTCALYNVQSKKCSLQN